MRSDEKSRSKTIRKVLYFQARETRDYGTNVFYFLDEEDNIYVHYQVSISRIKTSAGIKEARVWYSFTNDLKKGDKVLAACCIRQMARCEFAEKQTYLNVDKILKRL